MADYKTVMLSIQPTKDYDGDMDSVLQQRFDSSPLVLAWWYALPGLYIIKTFLGRYDITDDITENLPNTRHILFEVDISLISGRLDDDRWADLLSKFEDQKDHIFERHVRDKDRHKVRLT